MPTAHEFLTDQGAYTHEHVEADYEDIGDGESGPHLVGGPAYDVYSGDSHCLYYENGRLVHMEKIDWDEYRYFEETEAEFL